MTLSVIVNKKFLLISIYLIILLPLFLNLRTNHDICIIGKAVTIEVGPSQTYTTIQEGIDVANPGDTVYVHAGIYHENVVINKSICLIGENKNTTIINGKGIGNCIFIDMTDYVNISGFNIRNGSCAIYMNFSSHCNISNNIVCDISEHSIFLLSSSQDNIIANNTIYNISFNGIYLKLSSHNFILHNIINETMTGIYIYMSNYTLIRDNIAYNNDINGIEISNSLNNILINNTITDTEGNGILAFISINIILDNNIINNNWCGIMVDRSDNNIVTNNMIYKNSNFGIAQTRSYNNTYLNNIFFNNTRGIHLFKSANNSFSSNELNDSDYGISVQESNDNFFEKNNISNFEYGLYIVQTSVNNTYININIFGGDYGIYSNGNSNNTIINCSISNTNIYDFYLSENSHVVALNTTFLSEKVCFEDNLSNLSIEWYLMIYVNFTNGTPIKNAYIEVHDFYNKLIKSDNTDINGYLQWIIIKERVQNSTINISYTPHNISAEYDSIMKYVSPEPILNFSTQINITFKSAEVQTPLHHINIIPQDPQNYYIGDTQIFTVVGWNDAAETQENLTWTPVWNVDNTIIATIESDTGFFTALALGSSFVNVTSTDPTGIYATSQFIVEPWPLHHIKINPAGFNTYYLGDTQTYTAIGWNDASETQENLTWVPNWSVDNSTIASIDPVTGEFTALALGSSSVNVTDSTYQVIFNTSAFIIEPWPLHHIVITPLGSERYYVGDERSYSASGWNDAEETQQNITWTPVWIVDNSSIATIASDTGEFTAIALGNSVVNVTAASTGIYNTSSFIVEPWPLDHIVITPLGPESYYVGDTQTYTVIGWNDAQETQMNTTWTPVWEVDETTIATIDSDSGFFTATNIGKGNVRCRSTAIPEISNTSSFSVLAWPLHHISIIPQAPQNYYIGDTQIFTAVGWNDAEETQMNETWIPVWNVGNTSVASINETGFFTAIALGSSVVNVTCTSQTWINSVVVFTVNPWPLHHISILPAGPKTYHIGDIVIYTAIAWNDVEETQMNTTWTPVWTLEGEIQELTWGGEEARLEAKKSGEGSIKCSDEATNIYSTSEIVIKDKAKDGTFIWLWVLLVIIVVVLLIIFFLIYHKKNQGNTGKEDSGNNSYR